MRARKKRGVRGLEGLGVSSPYKFEEICNFEKSMRYFVNSRNFRVYL
jgi:hypothetical protein